MFQYVCVAEDENDEGIEIPVDQDGTILLSTIAAQFHSACGIKYRAESGKFRAVPLVDGHFQALENWEDYKYIVVYPKGLGFYEII